MENMLLGTGIFMLSMMCVTLIYSRFLSRKTAQQRKK